MNTFLLSLLVIAIGGLFPLLSYKQFSLMKSGYIAITLAGCIVGLSTVIAPLTGGLVEHYSRSWLQIFSFSLTLDSLSAFFLIPVFAVCPLAVIYSFHYMDKEELALRAAANSFFFNLLVVTMALVATADNIFSFAISWELMSLTSFFLVMYEYQKEETRKAGYIYFVFAQAGALCIFTAFALVYSQTGSFDFASFGALPANLKYIVFLLTLAGFGSKAGIFPLHIWLPHAHPAAPSNISAVMSGVMIKMGIYGIIRMYFALDSDTAVYGQTVLVFGMVSGILGVVYALGKHDLKKLLAYHSVENIGIILIGAGIGMLGVASHNSIMAGFGFAGCLLHVLNHSIFKPLLFLGAGAVLQKTGSRQLDQLGGLMKRMGTTGKTFLIGSISISGLPPFNGFISEFLIYYAAFQGLTLSGSTCILAMLAILSLALIGGLAAACFSKVVGIVFLGEPRSPRAADAKEVGFAMKLPMIILAAACILIGVFPTPFIQGVMNALQAVSLSLPDNALVSQVGENLGFGARTFLCLVIFSMLLRKVLYRNKAVEKSSTWGCGFTQPTVRIQYTGTSYAMSIVEFFKPFVLIRTNYSGIRRIFPGKTTYSTHVDDLAEMTLFDWIVSPFLFVLSKFRWIQHGHIQLYIAYIIITITVLLLLM